MLRRGKIGLWIVLVVAGVLTSGGPVRAEWSRFRGPNGTGIAPDKNIPLHWTEQDGVVWKTAIPGGGNSSPVVWENFIFLQTASADGKERRLLCVNAGDGAITWSRSLPGSRAHTHPKNTLASSTPATDGQRVYALVWDGNDLTLAAYDFKGNLAWKRDLGPFASQHGAGTSPIVYRDKVYLANDQDGSSLLLALDAATGKTVWQVPRKAFRACYSTPFVLEPTAGEKAELIVASTAGLTAYDLQTGDPNWNWTWHFSGMALRTVSSPVAGDGLFFVNSGDGSGERHTVAVKLGGQGDATGTHLAWESTKRNFPYVPSMLAWDKHVYFVSDQGQAVCLLAETGETVWTQRLGGNVSASPVLIDGNIYVVDEEGTVSVFPAAPTFKLLAKNSVGERVMATPAVSDNRLFIRGQEHLFCIARPAAKGTAGGQ